MPINVSIYTAVVIFKLVHSDDTNINASHDALLCLVPRHLPAACSLQPHKCMFPALRRQRGEKKLKTQLIFQFHTSHQRVNGVPLLPHAKHHPMYYSSSPSCKLVLVKSVQGLGHECMHDAWRTLDKIGPRSQWIFGRTTGELEYKFTRWIE